MLKDLKIPHMGSVENAKLVGWRVAEGGAFQAGDVLYEVETDKTTTEVEADEPGVLARQTAAEGDEFKVGDRIGFWAAPGTGASAIGKALAELDGLGGADTIEAAQSVLPARVPTASAQIRPVSRSAAQGVRISPLARRLAALHGIDPALVSGSGPGGRIKGDDILAATAKSPAISAPPLAAPVSGETTLILHSTRRQTIARRMTQAAAIPSLTADMEIDLTALQKYRQREAGISVLALIAHEAVSALAAHPRLNAHWRDDAMLQWNTVHLGVAVDTDDGLVVPVIRNAERLSARGLTAAIAENAEKARAGKLRVEDLEGGTFTISNPGSLGPVIRAEALLNPPQVALLGLPGMVHMPKAIQVDDGWAFAVRPVIRPSLTFDHRALDGGPVIAFLNELKARIEAL